MRGKRMMGLVVAAVLGIALGVALVAAGLPSDVLLVTGAVLMALFVTALVVVRGLRL